jgi:hypothetical protein
LIRGPQGEGSGTTGAGGGIAPGRAGPTNGRAVIWPGKWEERVLAPFAIPDPERDLWHFEKGPLDAVTAKRKTPPN